MAPCRDELPGELNKRVELGISNWLSTFDGNDHFARHVREESSKCTVGGSAIPAVVLLARSQQNNLLFSRTQRPTLKAKIGIQIDTQRRR
jgi:hypothetical protein